jgi:hypothetical protein
MQLHNIHPARENESALLKKVTEGDLISGIFLFSSVDGLDFPEKAGYISRK